ncbi:hypothetical protein C0J52_11003 [Blattella germanica]|nr:hypothetical protein C0J52_11003 [Blattella germanica]
MVDDDLIIGDQFDNHKFLFHENANIKHAPGQYVYPMEYAKKEECEREREREKIIEVWCNEVFCKNRGGNNLIKRLEASLTVDTVLGNELQYYRKLGRKKKKKEEEEERRRRKKKEERRRKKEEERRRRRRRRRRKKKKKKKEKEEEEEEEQLEQLTFQIGSTLKTLKFEFWQHHTPLAEVYRSRTNSLNDLSQSTYKSHPFAQTLYLLTLRGTFFGVLKPSLSDSTSPLTQLFSTGCSWS